MATPTPRIALTRDDGPDNYSVLRVNNNSDKIDEYIGATPCTSGARPSTGLFDGRLAYEADTNALISYKTTGATWRYLTPAHVSSKAAQDALTPKHDGMQVWRTDRDWMACWTGSAFYVPATAVLTSVADRTAEFPSPIQGQRVFLTDFGLEFIYWAGSWSYSPKKIGGEWQANANKNIVTGSNKIQYGTSIMNFSMTVIGSDGFQVPNDGLYAMSVYNKFGFAPGLPTSVSASIGGVSFATPMHSGEEFVSGTDVRASCTKFLSAGDIVCSYIYLNDATTRLLDVSARPSYFSIWRVG